MNILGLDNLRMVLYVAILIELLLFIGSGYSTVALLMIGFTSIAILIRVRIFRNHVVIDNEWIEIRSKLNQILIESKIIEKAPVQRLPGYSEGTFVNDKATTSLHTLFSPSVIEELRLLGLDGILICLYLLKNRNSFHSIKAIHESLLIPRATVYRNIQKLLDLDYVHPKSQFDDPSKSYYNITYEGEVLMFDFYDLIHMQPTMSRPIETQISVSCTSCGFSNISRSDFCGNCGRKL